MNLRHKHGATLGLVAAIALVLAFIGFAIFFVAQFLGGGKQIANATDAGAISAAKELEAVTVDLNSLNFVGIPVELEGLAVDTTTGAPKPTSALYNIYAYNRAAGAAALMCANAELENTPSAAANCATIVQNLQTIGTQLTKKLHSAIKTAGANRVWTAFQNTAYSNNVNMMGHGAGSVATLEKLQAGWVGSTDIAGNQIGKANIYFNSNLTNTFIGPYLPPTASGGVTSNTQASYAGSIPSAQAGQPFVPGYTKIDYGAGIGGTPGLAGVPPFYAVAVNPQQFPHLVDINRFSGGTKAPDDTTITTSAIPFNSVEGTTKTQETDQTNMFTSAIASAVIGTGNNMYPVTLVHGFVMLSNDHSYKYNAQLADGPMQPAVLQQVPAGENDSIFNYELYEAVGGAVDTYQTASSTAPNGLVFGVESGPTLMKSTPTDASMGNISNQISTWWSPYLASTGSDVYGHDINKDPTGGQLTLGPGNTTPTNTFVKSDNLWLMNDNARLSPSKGLGAGIQNIVQASAVDMAKISGGVVKCHDLVYRKNTPVNCTNASKPHLTGFRNSFGRTDTAGSTYSGDGQITGGLTSLEYLKGLVITAFSDMILQSGVNPYYSVQIPTPANSPAPLYQFPPATSGSRIYNRNAGYAQPTNAATLQFGSNGTPYALLEQIIDGSLDPLTTANLASCPGNIDLSVGSPLWYQSSSLQGQLLQRCLEIDPTCKPASLVGSGATVGLLNTGAGLDLGQSDVIYWDTTTNKLTVALFDPANAATLKPFPAWLQTQLKAIAAATSPSVYLDGNVSPACGNQPWDSITPGNVVNAAAGQGTPANSLGDYDVHEEPFSSATPVANPMGTSDSAIWTPNSGKGGLLGQLLFQQQSDINIGGSGPSQGVTFGAPN